MTKSIRITEKTHSQLKIHVAKNKKSIVAFADRAIKDAIEMDKLRAKNLKSLK
jgi:hypothetical protein